MMRAKRCLFALPIAFLAGCGGGQQQSVLGSGTAGDGQPSAPVVLPVPEDATISFVVWFPVGSDQDPSGKEGLAWLTGQLLAEGGTKANSYEQILKRLFPMAASYSVRVDREMTTLHARVHRDHLDAFFALLVDAYARPAFAKEDVERLRSRGISYLEKTLRYASDEELAKAALNQMIFGKSAYAHPIIGTGAGLRSITSDDIRSFYQQHYTGPSVTFAIGGGYPAELVKRLEATRSLLPAGKSAMVPPPAPEPARGRRVLLVDKGGADASISLGFPIDVHRGERDYYALWIATSWLGEHRNGSSHLYQVIRESRGLNYGDYAYIEAFPEGGELQLPPTNVARSRQFFEIWIRTLPNDQAIFALRAALRELKRLVDDGMTQEQFELTRSFLRKHLLHYAPTTHDRLGYAVDDRYYGISAPGHLARAQDMLKSLSRQDVNRAIQRHLQYKDMYIAIVTGKAGEMKKALAAGDPTPIHYPTAKPAAIIEEDKAIAKEPLSIAADAVETRPVDSMFGK
jgi:zinc protease